jgi:hypothetical protein
MNTKTVFVVAGALLIAAGIAYAVPETQSPLRAFSTQTNEGATRACVFPSGGWTKIDCSNSAAASSAALTEWTRYIVQCGDDSYLATGTAASGQDADANDGWLPAGAWLEFMTTDTIRYLSCLNKNSDSDCRILECK